MVLITTLIHGWFTKQIDFLLVYTQADVECQLYMAIPKGFEDQDEGQDYALKLVKNLIGQKQAGRVWNQHLVNKLMEVGFIPSKIDECLFYKGKSVFVLYTDDSILGGPDPQELDNIIQEMKAVGLNLTVEGNISDFLGVQLTGSMRTPSISHNLNASQQKACLQIFSPKPAMKRLTPSCPSN
jgi:hypothetical protein